MSSKGKYFKVYQASAGSGKTFTIVKEYLKLCLKSAADTSNYKKILAVTFTNKSANDMKAKVLNHLIEIIGSNNGTGPSAMENILLQELGIGREDLKHNASELFHKIIHDYSSFCISTIDAFVQKLARTFAKDLNLPNQYSVLIDDDEFSDRIIERIGDQIDEDNKYLTNVLVDFVQEKMDDESDWNIEKSLRTFIKKLLREEAYEKNEIISLAEAQAYKTTKEQLEIKVNGNISKIKSFTEKCESIFNKYQIEKDDLYQGSRGIYGFLLKLSAGDIPTPNKYVSSVVNGQAGWFSKSGEKKFSGRTESIQEELNDISGPFFKSYEKESGDTIIYKSILKDLYLYALRSKIKIEADAFIEESQKVHISEFNKRLADILDDFSVPFIYERIGEKYEHFFVDEFQDTSLLQWQNFMPLIDNSLSKSCMNLIVGDGKQSIYRFRNGEVEQLVNLPEIFMKPSDNPIVDDYEHNLINNFDFFNLNRNYRSFKEIVNFNNDFFEHCLNFLAPELQKVYKEENGKYGKCVSIKQESIIAESGLVQIELFDEKNLKSNDHPDEPVLNRILCLIQELSQEYDYRDITILTRSNAKGSLIANYLNDKNIPIISADSILLKSSDKVQLIVETLSYMLHNDNPITIASLIYFWESTHNKDFDGELNGLFSTVKAISKAEAQLEPLIGLEEGQLSDCLSRAQSLYDLCSALIRLYKFNSIRDPYLNFFMEEVQNWQSSEELGIENFLEFWDKKKNDLSVKTSGSANAVNITTVHKSKGLEFKVVIYPYAINNLDSGNNTLSEQWLTQNEIGLTETIPNLQKILVKLSKKNADCNQNINTYYENEQAKTQLDNLNILYVALTRAKEKLYILSSHKKDDEKKDKVNLFDSFLNQEGMKEHMMDSDPIKITYRFGKSKENKKAINNALDEDVDIDSKSGDWYQRIKIDPTPSMFWASQDDNLQPQDWGNLVHSILSNINTLDDIDSAFTPFILEGSINKQKAEELKTLFKTIVAEKSICEAFSTNAIVKNECDILTSDGKIIRPDRFAELQNKIYILDYKTGKEDPKHHQQLTSYVNSVKQMVDKEISAYLVYITNDFKITPVSITSNPNP